MTATLEDEKFPKDIENVTISQQETRPDKANDEKQLPNSPVSKKPQITTSTPPAPPDDATSARHKKWLRLRLVLILSLPSFLAAADATITATAVNPIASYFDKFDQFGWVVNAYTLTSTAFIPFYGQIADIFGRHAALQLSMSFMVVGSVLAAAAQTWGMLLLGRALQGLSGAGIINLVRITMADGVDLAEQSKRQTIWTLVIGVSYSIGPVIGGALAAANWRYVFVLSIPVAVLSQILLFFVIRTDMREAWHRGRGEVAQRSTLEALGTIDVGGLFLFVFGVGLIVLGLSWAGSTYAWNSAAVIVPLALGGVLFASFWFYEWLLEPGNVLARHFPQQKAMISWAIFTEKDTFLLCIINTAAGAALFSSFYFVSLFWEVAQGYSSTSAGLRLLFYVPGIGIGTYIALFTCNIWPRQTFPTIFLGTWVETIGLGVLCWAFYARDVVAVNLLLAIAGAGTGMRFMPILLHATGVWPDRKASVVSLLDFWNPFGGTVALAVMAAVFSNKFANGLAGISGLNKTSALKLTVKSAERFFSHDLSNLPDVSTLPADVVDMVQDAAAKAVMWAFISILPVLLLSAIAAGFLGVVFIAKGKKSRRREEHLSTGECSAQGMVEEVMNVNRISRRERWALKYYMSLL